MQLVKQLNKSRKHWYSKVKTLKSAHLIVLRCLDEIFDDLYSLCVFKYKVKYNLSSFFFFLTEFPFKGDRF